MTAPIGGVGRIASTGRGTVLAGASPSATNALADPVAVAPEIRRVDGLGAVFDRALPPYSVTVLELNPA